MSKKKNKNKNNVQFSELEMPPEIRAAILNALEIKTENLEDDPTIPGKCIADNLEEHLDEAGQYLTDYLNTKLEGSECPNLQAQIAMITDQINTNFSVALDLIASSCAIFDKYITYHSDE